MAVLSGDGTLVDNSTTASVTITGIQYIHADHLNTLRVITSVSTGANNVLWRWDSDPFSLGFPNEDVDGNGVKFTYNPRFPGQYFDGETNNHYTYFRDYDPSLRRYVQSDPIGLFDDVNTYAYVGSNPAYWVDSLGLGKVISVVHRIEQRPRNPNAATRSEIASRTDPAACDHHHGRWRPECQPDRVAARI